MVFNRQALFICAVFVVISLSQLGNIAAGDLAEESEILTSVMSKIGQIIGIIGIIGTLLTFPLMLIAAILEKITPLSLNTVFEILYLMLGVLIINSKKYRDTFNVHGNFALVAFLTMFSLFQFIFDYMQKIAANRIALELQKPDALDMLGITIFLSFSVMVSLLVSSAVVYLIKKK